MIYLDNASTTPLYPEVIQISSKILEKHFGNPSSLHQLGRESSKLLRQSRESLSHLLDVPANTLSFTSGATEANNHALIGYALANADKGRHIVTSSIEHPSVLKTLQYLEERFGFNITTVTPDSNGILESQRILSAIQEDTFLVSIMMANNETGQLLPVKELGNILEASKIAFHVDATQAMGKIPVLPREIKADFLTASAHKFHGPKGIGFLYHSDKVNLDPIIHGGAQEANHRAGTENLVAIIGMVKALEIACQNQKENFNKVYQLKEFLLESLSKNKINFYKNQFGESLPHVINLGFPNHKNDLLLTQLDLAGIAVSSGSACSAGTITPSHVLEVIYGLNSEKLHENLRISLSELNTISEIQTLITTLKGIL
ncbi:MAG: cysteine desulfurase family protein [Lactovum sp.]